jgi:hypothetical protein
MRERAHQVRRFLIELRIPRAEDAARLQERFGRLCRDRVVPLLDRACSARCGPDRIVRIDSVEIDLGWLDLEASDAELADRIGQALDRRLVELIEPVDAADSRHEDVPEARSNLELFDHFARTGRLPWWASTPRHRPLVESLDDLLSRDPSELVRLLAELLGEDRPARRIVRHLDDERLSRLFGLLVSPRGGDTPLGVRDLLAVVREAALPLAPGRDPRFAFWHAALPAAAANPELGRAPAALCAFLLSRVAVALQIGTDALAAAVCPLAAAAAEPLRTTLTEAVAALAHRPGRPPAGDDEGEAAEPLDLGPVSRREEGGPWARLFEVLAATVPRLPAPVQERWLASLLGLERHRSPGPARTGAVRDLARSFASDVREHAPELAPALAACSRLLLEVPYTAGTPGDAFESVDQFEDVMRVRGSAADASDQPGQAPDLPLDLIAALPIVLSARRAELAPALSWALRALAARAARPDRRRARSRASAGDDDDIPIGNAGLVLLAPFLRPFFGGLGLLDDDRFRDPAAMHRAVGLLDYLVHADPEPAEYELPLARVLCGMDLDEVFDFGPPVSESEAEGCSSLLRSVIGHASILGEMSVDGFRGSFLIRQGLLGTRDGCWLLRVEGRTYDVVLERFPWTWAWIRLRWMEAPLRVEW